MSFGVGLMDIVGVAQFSWKLYRALRDSSEDFRRLSSEVGAMHTVLLETEACMKENPAIDDEKQRRLTIVTDSCHDTLHDIQRLLDNYESLGTHAQRTWDRMAWGLKDISDVRLRLISNTTSLGAFATALNNSSVVRMDKRLAKFMTEVMAGLRNGSVVTASDVAETIDTPGVWEQLRRELEDVGISEAVIEANRDYIAAWFKDTLQDGLAGLDDGNDMFRMPAVSKSMSVDSGRISPCTVPSMYPPPPGMPERQMSYPETTTDSGYGGSRMSSISSMKSAMDGFAEDLRRNNSTKTVEETMKKLEADGAVHVVLKKKATPVRVLMKLMQKDDAIIQAASDGDIKKVAKLISLGMNVNARDRWG